MHKILFLGQNWFGEAAWRRLRHFENEILQVVAVCSNPPTQPSWWQSHHIFENSEGVPFIENTSRNEHGLLEVIEKYEVDTILSVQHPWVLTADTLQAVNYNAFNFHNAKLPEYRGYNAINHAILNREDRFTCTVHWMGDKVDRGDIAYEATFRIAQDETAISLYAKCYYAGLGLFDKVLSDMIAFNPIPRRAMVGQGKFHSRHSIDTERKIKSLKELEPKSRAFYFPPFEPAFVLWNDRKVYVLPQTINAHGFKSGSLEILREVLRTTEGQFQWDLY